jgi:hypothetical protein
MTSQSRRPLVTVSRGTTVAVFHHLLHSREAGKLGPWVIAEIHGYGTAIVRALIDEQMAILFLSACMSQLTKRYRNVGGQASEM